MKIKRGAGKAARIEMLPLIDIVFLLLVFFIYAMLSMAVHRGLTLDLPESTQARAGEELSLSLSLQLRGREMELFLDDEPVVLGQLPGRLAAKERRGKGVGVLLFAEEGISYQQLFQVLDQLRLAHVENISLQASAE